MKLRLATASDVDFTFEWRNDIRVRQYAFDSSELLYSAHQQWFLSKIACAKTNLLIAESEEGRPSGVLRFDYEVGIVEVSLYLNPDLCGKGIGKEMLLVGMDWLKENRSDVRKIRAKVLPGNIASHKVFEKAGFKVLCTEYGVEL